MRKNAAVNKKQFDECHNFDNGDYDDPIDDKKEDKWKISGDHHPIMIIDTSWC